MDVIYTDKTFGEIGVLQGFTLDVDVAGERDFEIKVPSDHEGLVLFGYWYIEGMEYGGRIENIKVDTDAGELIYSGRNWRGILASKIVCPPEGEAHRYLSGSWRPMMQALFEELGLSDLFLAEDAAITCSEWRVGRYVTLLEMIEKLLKEKGYRLNLRWSGADGRVRVGAVPIRDLTDTVQYETGDHVGLVVEDKRGGVNHLICLGQGELEKREVVHLYCTATGAITELTQHYKGLDEIQAVYDNSSAADRDELKSSGFEHLKELRNSQTFSATVEDYDVQIGDIVGGVERVTGIRVAEPITNIIFKIADGIATSEYKVGGEGSGSSSSSGGSATTGTGLSSGVDPLSIYPVGSIYMSAVNADPALLFGGVWTQIKDCFLLAAGSTYAGGSTGGEASVTLTADQMPEHEHSLIRPKWYSKDTNAQNSSSGAIYGTTATTTPAYFSEASEMQPAGGGQAHNNMPPYLAVYVWQRVS